MPQMRHLVFRRQKKILSPLEDDLPILETGLTENEKTFRAIDVYCKEILFLTTHPVLKDNTPTSEE